MEQRTSARPPTRLVCVGEAAKLSDLMGMNLKGRKVLQVAAGAVHTVLVLEDGTAVAFGGNHYGQTKVPDLKGKPLGRQRPSRG